MAEAGRAHVEEHYSFDKYEKSWVDTIDDCIEKNGSWENRKNYKRWHLREVA